MSGRPRPGAKETAARRRRGALRRAELTGLVGKVADPVAS